MSSCRAQEQRNDQYYNRNRVYQKSPEAFDSKINNWAEGILLTIDADGSRLTIRGRVRPYASHTPKC